MNRPHLLIGLVCLILPGTACQDPEPVLPEPRPDLATADMTSPDQREPEEMDVRDLANPQPDASMDMAVDAASDDLGVEDMLADVGVGDLGQEPDLVDMQPPLPDLEPLRTAIEDDLARSNATAASVAIWLDGRIIWVGGFGQTDEGRVPDEQTQFMIGSDTKKLACLTYLKQVERGLATLDTTLGELYPTLSFPYAQNYTLASAHDFMSNQGGLSDHVGDFSDETTDEQLLSYVNGPMRNMVYELAPPGVFYNYSNPSFSMIGLMTESVTGKFWADAVQDDILTPLDMTRTVARKSLVDENRATGVGQVNFRNTTVQPVSFEQTWENAFVRPAGLIWSTPTDQMKLARFLNDGNAQVLRDDLRALLSTPHAPTFPDMPGDYGYGLTIGQGVRLGDAGYFDVPVWSHGGNTLTHTSTFYVLPEQRFAISILSNGLGDNFVPSVVTAMRTLVDLPEPSTAPDVVFDPDGIDALTGDYEDPYNLGRVKITRVGDALRIDMPDVTQAGVPYEADLVPISTRVWRANIQNTPMILQFFDGPGRTMYMANRAFVAKKELRIIIGLEKSFVFDQERFDAAIARERLPRPDRLLWPFIF